MEVEVESQEDDLEGFLDIPVIVPRKNHSILVQNIKPEKSANPLIVQLDITRSEKISDYENQQQLLKRLQNAEIIELEVGRAMKRRQQTSNPTGLIAEKDWIRFLKAVKNPKSLKISIHEKISNRRYLTEIGLELLRLNKLEKLELEFANETLLGISGFTQIGEAIQTMNLLEELTIFIGESNQLRDEGAMRLFSGFDACQSLRKISFHVGCHNQLNSEGISAISTSIGSLVQLNDFNLSIAETNSLGVQGVRSIFKNAFKQNLRDTTERLTLKIGDRRCWNTDNVMQMFSVLSEFARLEELTIELSFKGEMKASLIQFISENLRKIQSLKSLSFAILSDPHPLHLSPMTALLSQYSLSKRLQNVQLRIPPNSQFNNLALSMFARNLKSLAGLQVFQLEIEEYNILGISLMSKEGINTKKDNQKIIFQDQQQQQQQQSIKMIDNKNTKLHKTPQVRGIHDMFDVLGSLRRLEKVIIVISEKNDISDGGWECLSKSTSLKEFKVKIGEGCRLLNEGLFSISKISENVRLEALSIEVGEGNEINEETWKNFMKNMDLVKLMQFSLSVGGFNEYSDNALELLARNFQKSPQVSAISDDTRATSFNSNSILSPMFSDPFLNFSQLNSLTLNSPADTLISPATLNSLSNALNTLKLLTQMKIFLTIDDSTDCNFLDQMKLISTICQLEHLSYLELSLQGNHGVLKGRNNSIPFETSPPEHTSMLEFSTETNLQFKMISLPKMLGSLEFIDTFTQSLALLPSRTTYLSLQLNISNVLSQAFPQLHSIGGSLGDLKNCTDLKLNLLSIFVSEDSLDDLASSVSKMFSLTRLSLKINGEILSLKAGQTLADFCEKSLRNLKKVKLILNFYHDLPQSKAYFLVLNAMLKCPNLVQLKVEIRSYLEMKLEVKSLASNRRNNEDLLTKPVYDSASLHFSQSEMEPSKDYCLFRLANFLKSNKIFQNITLSITSRVFISTKIAQRLYKGLGKHKGLNQLNLEFKDKCVVSGESVVLLAKSIKKIAKLRTYALNIKTNHTFSLLEGLSVMVNLCNSSNLSIKRNQLDITGGKVIVSSRHLSNMRQLIQVQPRRIFVYSQIQDDFLKQINISEVLEKLALFSQVTSINIDVSQLIQEQQESLNSFEQLTFLTCLSITDESPRENAQRFRFLESALSKLATLSSLTLKLKHTEEEYADSNDFIFYPIESNSFGRMLGNLKRLKKLTLLFDGFQFGNDNGKSLGQGIQNMLNLQQLTIICRNNSLISSEGVEQLSEIILKKAKAFQQFTIEFQVLETTPESTCFKIINNLQLKRIPMSELSNIRITGKITQTLALKGFFSQNQIKNSIYFNGSNQDGYSHEISLQNLKHQDNGEFVRQLSAELIDLQFGQDIFRFDSITVWFDLETTNLETRRIMELNVLFLQTLFVFLEKSNRFVSVLKICIAYTSPDQLQAIVENALKDMCRIDILQFVIEKKNPFELKIKDFQSLAVLQRVSNLRIFVKSLNVEQGRLLNKFLLRKLKRLTTLQIMKN